MFLLWLRLMRSEEQWGQGAWGEVIYLACQLVFGQFLKAMPVNRHSQVYDII